MTLNQLKQEYWEFAKKCPLMDQDERETLQAAQKYYFDEKCKSIISMGENTTDLTDILVHRYFESFLSGGQIMHNSVLETMDKVEMYLDTLVKEEIILPAIREDILNIFKNNFLEPIGNTSPQFV